MLTCSVAGCGKPSFQRGWCSMHYSRWRRHGTLEKTGTANGEPMAYFQKAVRIETDDCVLWPYSRSDAGYGKIERKLVHRMSCERAYGPPPSPEHHAAHRCHTPACFNSKHLYWATPSENQRDRVQDGTSNRGGNFRNSKLTADQVRTIRRLAAQGVSHTEIAPQYGVARTAITRIVNGVRWGWLA